MADFEKILRETSYPGRGIMIGRSADGTKALTAYFIMGRSVNSRNRIFVEEGEGIRTEAFDPSKMEDPSLIIYAPVRVYGNKTIVTNGDQTDTIYEVIREILLPACAIHLLMRIPRPARAVSSPLTWETETRFRALRESPGHLSSMRALPVISMSLQTAYGTPSTRTTRFPCLHAS